MLAGKINSLPVILFLVMTAAGQNVGVTTNILNTTSAEITSFHVVAGSVVDFEFTIANTGNVNISVFPEVRVNNSQGDTEATLYSSTVNITVGSSKDLTLSWSPSRSGNFNATLTAYYDSYTRWATESRNFAIVIHSVSEAGSGSGAGVISKEPLDNVRIWEMRERYLQKDLLSSYLFTLPDLVIYEVLVYPLKNYGTTSMKIEELEGLSRIKGVTQPPGIIYEHVNIWIGAGDVGIKDGIVRFKVNNLWIDENSFDYESIKLLEWEGGEWVLLETEPKGRNEKFTYYESRTDTFSPFAVSFISPETEIAGPDQTGEIPETTAYTPFPPNQEKKGLESTLWLTLLILLVLVGILSYSIMLAKQK